MKSFVCKSGGWLGCLSPEDFLAMRLKGLKCTMVICCMAAIQAQSYPWHWMDQGSCGLQPTSVEAHGKRLIDRQISFTISSLEPAYGGKALSTLCPGEAVVVKVTWPSSEYRVLVTTSQGELSHALAGPCHRSSFTVNPTNAFAQELRLPCDSQGQVLLEVSAAKAGSPLHYNSLTLPVDTSCANPMCSHGSDHDTMQSHAPVYHPARHGRNATPHIASTEEVRAHWGGVAAVQEPHTGTPQQHKQRKQHIQAQHDADALHSGQGAAAVVKGSTYGSKQHQKQAVVSEDGVREHIHQLSNSMSHLDLKKQQQQAKAVFQLHMEQQRHRRQQELHRRGQANGVTEGREQREPRTRQEQATAIQPRETPQEVVAVQPAAEPQGSERLWRAAGLEQQTARAMPRGLRLPLATGKTGVAWRGEEDVKRDRGYQARVPQQDEPEDQYTWADGQQDDEDEGNGLLLGMGGVQVPGSVARSMARKLLRAGWAAVSAGHGGLLAGKRAEL